MNTFICFIFSILLLNGRLVIAQQDKALNKTEVMRQELLNVDAQFSKLSETRGVNEAFLSYIADDGVLLRSNNFPIVGKEIIRERYFSRSDSGYTLTWKALYADIAQSGELGYTYGVYEFKAMDAQGKPIIGNGTYVSVWKKDQFGNWKLVLDSGNEGLGSEKH